MCMCECVLGDVRHALLKLYRNPDRVTTNARFDTQKLENEMFSVELPYRVAVLEVVENISESYIQMEKSTRKLRKKKKKNKQWLR